MGPFIIRNGFQIIVMVGLFQDINDGSAEKDSFIHIHISCNNKTQACINSLAKPFKNKAMLSRRIICVVCFFPSGTGLRGARPLEQKLLLIKAGTYILRFVPEEVQARPLEQLSYET